MVTPKLLRCLSHYCSLGSGSENELEALKQGRSQNRALHPAPTSYPAPCHDQDRSKPRLVRGLLRVWPKIKHTPHSRPQGSGTPPQEPPAGRRERLMTSASQMGDPSRGRRSRTLFSTYPVLWALGAEAMLGQCWAGPHPDSAPLLHTRRPLFKLKLHGSAV